ncbi:glycoside hydrolase family 16 protein [Lindgomyces ingoldianus]|uniref:Glycoside hydrolase family 16 protein n=1 Tax=Lindgomyces ingoldianus TaxID=673940 RepID=A0ACB6QTG2_9PLEO|nr:glycoside hydrolase family 16 protein [Lindgomyces ingoldianus]KAF2469587.1 glycoside hydrolase family 16 protein [Lindgomyces ingoldianus]
MLLHLLVVPTFVVASTCASAPSYKLNVKYDASNFFDSFDFFTDTDPTNGNVSYISYPEASSTSKGPQLAKYDNNKVYLGADSTQHFSDEEVANKQVFRKSVRVESIQTFDTGLFVGDFEHVPGSACGVWPAFWVLHDNDAARGSNYGEVDIYEGISLNTANEMTMHTNQHCTIPTENPDNGNCLDPEGVAAGCEVDAPDGTFGDEFNKKGGGVWALLLDNKNVKIWYFENAKIPQDLRDGNPNPTKWGKGVLDVTPKGSSCDMKKAFQKMKIILNITFCGDMADDKKEKTWEKKCAAATGVKTCAAYVGQNEHAFDEAYFLINSLTHYLPLE